MLNADLSPFALIDDSAAAIGVAFVLQLLSSCYLVAICCLDVFLLLVAATCCKLLQLCYYCWQLLIASCCCWLQFAIFVGCRLQYATTGNGRLQAGDGGCPTAKYKVAGYRLPVGDAAAASFGGFA